MSGATSSIGVAGLGAQGFGAGYSAVGSYFTAESKKIGLKGEAQTADANARIMELAAQGELLSGQRREQAEGLKTANLKSSQKVAMAANGVDIGSDTAVNILTTTDTFGEIAKNTEAANAARSAWGYRTQATNYTNAARTARSNAESINPFASGLTSLINSTSALVKSKYEYDKQTKDSGPRDTSAVVSAAPSKEYGPFDDSLPWRNIPYKALY